VSNPLSRLFEFIGREREEWVRTARVVRLGLRGLIKSQIPRMAAALSYRTIFSLIPVLVVSASVMGQFLSDVELESQINKVIEFIGLDTIALEDGGRVEAGGADRGSAADPGAASGGVDPALVDPGVVDPETVDPGAGDPERVDPGAGETGVRGAGLAAVDPTRLDEWITSLVERVTSLPFSQIGFIGLLVLVYGAIAMLVELERSLNQIYGVPNGRAWVKRVTTYWTTLTLGLVFLLATFSVGDRVGDWVASIGKADGEAQGWVAGNIVDFVVSVVINTILLLFAYMTVPNARVHFRPALIGAAVAGLGWEIGKNAFTAYVSNAVDNLQQLYGVLALLPLFLFWVYITWIIVLFGLQVAYSLQHFSVWSEEAEKAEAGLVDPGVAVRFAVMLAIAFEDGGARTVEDLADGAGVPAGAAGTLVAGLVKSGVARVTDLEGGETGYVLARPAERVMAAEILESARRTRAGGEQGGSSLVDARVRSAMEGVRSVRVGARARGGVWGQRGRDGAGVGGRGGR
jgi:membrane protein